MPRHEYLSVGILDVTEQIKGAGYLDGSGLPICAHDRYWVDSGTGSGVAGVDGTGDRGKTKARPYATLDYALSKAEENRGDQIICLPGHYETITGAGGINLDKAGVEIICLGRYDARPTFLMDGSDAVTMLVTEANIMLFNALFKAGHADIVNFATITAKGFHLINCMFEENATDENWKNVISAGAADNDFDGLEIKGCNFDMVDTASTGCITLNKNNKDVVLRGNWINGDYGHSPFAPIYAPATEVCKNIHVLENIVHNLHDGDAAVGISIANIASTGSITDNDVGHQDVAGETPILAGAAGLYVGNNRASGVLGTASGYPYPAIDS